MTVPDEKVLKELKIATGWDKIQIVGDSLVIFFSIRNIPTIKGLKLGKNNPFLLFESFNNYQISFFVTMNSATHQYWTLNGNMHRPNDKPAYVGTDNDTKKIIQRWFWNGIRHRTTGPAIISYTNLKINDLDGFEKKYRQNTWDECYMEWYHEGFGCEYPYPTSVKCTGGIEIFNKTSHKLESPREDLAAKVISEYTGTWDRTSKIDSDILTPHVIFMIDLAEIYSDGDIVNRECGYTDITWKRNGHIYEREITKFNKELRDSSLIKDLGLWGGPFYRNQSTEFLVLTEFNRIGLDDDS